MSVVVNEDDAADVEEMEEEEKHAFRVHDLASANWALGKLRYWQQRKTEIDQTEASMIAEAKKWAEAERDRLQPHIDNFENLLKLYHYEKFQEDEKRKTISLPYGELVTREGSVVVEVTDRAAFEKAAANGDLPMDLIRYKYEPIKAAIKKHVEETGEAIPGVKIEKMPRTFKVEVGKK